MNVRMTDVVTTFDPFAYFAELRSGGPVVRRDNVWLALSHQSCKRVLLDHSSFSSAPLNSVDGVAGPQLSMLSTDPPVHARYRSATSHAFSHSRVMAMHPTFTRTARSLTRTLGEGPELEVMAGLAEPLARAAIAAMVGVPEADRASFTRWCPAVMAVAGRGTRPQATAEDETAVGELKEYLRHALRSNTVHPDLLLGALGADQREGRITEDEAVSIAVAVLVGGIGTTAHLIGNALVALLEHEAVYDAVLIDRGLMPRALDETARHSPPVLAIPRWSRSDTVLEGQTIRAGSVVLAVIGSANRAPDVFSEGWRFDIHRRGAPGLAFGHGAHGCPGRGMALDVARTALEALLDRYPTLTPAAGAWVKREASLFVYGPKTAHVRVGERRP